MEEPPPLFDPRATGIDLESLLAELEASSGAEAPRPESTEVDLSVALDDMTPRDDVRRSTLERFEQDFKRGMVLLRAGDVDEAIAALRLASQAPRLRFATASVLGRIYRDKMPHCQFVLLYDAGHEAAADRPEAFTSLVRDFLERREAFIVTTRSALLHP